MKISIAMATYNGAEYIAEQLLSFEKQLLLPDELIISDDGSTDSTVDIIKAFADVAPFDVIVVFNKGRSGYASNFNNALSKVTGDLIFLSDQDDVWFPDKIKKMVSLSVNEPAYYVYMNDALLTNQTLESSGLTKINQIKNAGLSEEDFVMGCCCLIRRSFLNFALPIPDGIKSHDSWLVQISDCIGSRMILKEVLQLYRRHDANESKVVFNQLKTVNYASKYIKTIQDYLNRDLVTSYQEYLAESEAFILGLERVHSFAPDELKTTIYNLKCSKLDDYSIFKKRLDARGSNLFSRIFKVVHMFFTLYPANKRLAFAVRDILGL